MVDERIWLVIGATGFAGGALTQALRRRGRRVRAMVRSTSDAAALRDLGVELVEGDIVNPADVRRACEGVSVAYNFASPFRSAKPTDDYFRAVNVDGVGHLFDAAEHHGLQRVVHCSTIGVHGDVKEIPCRETSPYNPGDIYQQTKLEGERLARAALDAGRVPGVIMRPATMYGPGDMRLLKLFRMVQQRRFRMFGRGEALLHPAYIDDLVRGFLMCGERDEALGEVFIFAGPRAVTLNELVAEVARAVGVDPPRGRLPLMPLMAAAWLCEAVCRPLGLEPPLHPRRARLFVNNRSFDGTKARTVLGYEPKVGLREGLTRTAVWYAKQGLLDPVPSLPESVDASTSVTAGSH